MDASQNRYGDTTLYNVCEEERQDVIKLISRGGGRELQHMEKKSHLNMGSPWVYKLSAEKIVF